MTSGASLAFVRVVGWVGVADTRSWWLPSWNSFQFAFLFFCYPFIFTRSFYSALSYKFILKTWWDLIILLQFECVSHSAKLRRCSGSWIRYRYLGAGLNRDLQCKLHMINANRGLDKDLKQNLFVQSLKVTCKFVLWTQKCKAAV